MIWLLFVLGILVLAVISEDFRGCLLVLVGFIVVAVVCLVAYFIFIEKPREAERAERARQETELARQRIPADQIELDGLQLKPTYGTGSFDLVGRVRNRSTTYTLTGLQIHLTMRDCVAVGLETPPAEQCEVVGEETRNLYTDVPPQQARALEEHVTFASLGPPKGRHTWTYSIQWLEGK